MKVDTSKGYFIRRAQDRGFFDHKWLKTYHTFSFSDYFNPNFMGYRSLRVINEDTVAPKQGFPTHAHENMEIITVVLEGAVAHKDSMNNEEIIQQGEIQVMSAGKGVTHSEYNPSDSAPAHFLQIWIKPDIQNREPRYQQRSLPLKENAWVLMASKEGEGDSLEVQQDIKIYMLNLQMGQSAQQTLDGDRYGWIQIASGAVEFEGEFLSEGDGIALDAGKSFELRAKKAAQVIFFDLN